MNTQKTQQPIEKLLTGIESFDLVSDGSLPRGRTTLVTGTAGSGKTVLAAQFLAEGITKFDQNGVFVTFEESVDDIRKNIASLGWDIAFWEAEGRWRFVDASPQTGEETIVAGSYDLGPASRAPCTRWETNVSRWTPWAPSSAVSRITRSFGASFFASPRPSKVWV
jgi:circadian clock protein KaiC